MMAQRNRHIRKLNPTVVGRPALDFYYEETIMILRFQAMLTK